MLSLHDALETAFVSNRDHIAQKDSLYQTALSLTGVRFSYSPQVSAALTYIFAGGNSTSETHGAGVNGELSQVLPSGKAAPVASSGFDGGPATTSAPALPLAHAAAPERRGPRSPGDPLLQAERSGVGTRDSRLRTRAREPLDRRSLRASTTSWQ
ncbi:MAG: hypothetical protein IPJ19_18870 [Planctomycetes bacterium]|nr:hypothetical protein [Planctomycetota bacterium]